MNRPLVEPKLSKSPSVTGIALCVLICGLLSTVPFLGQLEFLRHTEADRTLIGWEMYTSGDWLVPHLLGDLYLTKPPLYYQYLAALFAVFGEPSEFAARLSSAISFGLLLCAQVVFATLAKLPIRTALLSAIALGTSAQVFTASVEAEIDLTLTLLTTIASWSGFLIFAAPANRGKAVAAASAGVFAALGFLIKGPPGLFFPFIAIGVFYVSWDRTIKSALFACGAGLISLGLVALWILALAERVSPEILWYHFNFEVLERVRADPLAEVRARPALFYLGTVIAGASPWILWLFSPRFWRERPPSSPFSRFCLGMIVPSLIVFSCASGKSSRYLLPLLPFVTTWIVANLSISAAQFKRVSFAAISLLLAVRLGYAFLYAPQRNSKHSVKFIAEDIAARGPREIFILEMFERWLPYYLVRSGISVRRLTPTNLPSLRDEELYPVLLSMRTEDWRLADLTSDPQTKTNTYTSSKSNFVLANVPGKTLKRLELSALFPTVATAKPRNN